MPPLYVSRARASFDPDHPLALHSPHLDFAALSAPPRATSRARGQPDLSCSGRRIDQPRPAARWLAVVCQGLQRRPSGPFTTLLFLLLLYGWSPWEAMDSQPELARVRPLVSVDFRDSGHLLRGGDIQSLASPGGSGWL
jgi:hypothetical protein